jgi:hypothetical protein
MTRVIEPLNENQEIELGENERLVNLLNEDTPRDTTDVQDAEKTQVTEKAQNEEEWTPPKKYENKSMQEIIQMHQEVEKLVGRQGTELGDLRRTVDDFIKSKSEEVKEKPKDERIVDFFEDPEAGVDARIQNNPELREVKELLIKQQRQEVKSRISSKYPDYIDTIQEPDFIDWVKGSKVRIELLQRADQFDFDAADELLSTWGERRSNVSKAKEVNEKDRKQQLKAASTGGKGSGEPISRKIYRRSDIVNLMMTDPDRYYANVEEFDRAYAEGRVK